MDVASLLLEEFPSMTASIFLGLSDQVWGIGLSYIANLRAQVDTKGWDSSNNYNQIWVIIFNDSNIITNVACDDSVYTCPAYLLQIPVSPQPERYRVRDNFLCCSCQERLLRKSNCCDPRVFVQGKDRDDPVTQWILLKNSVASTSNCFRISCKIALCVTCGRCVLNHNIWHCCLSSSWLRLLASLIYIASNL